MVIKYNSSCKYASQRRDDIHFAQFQRSGSYSASQSGQIVFVCIADFLNQAMLSQSFQKSGHLMALFALDNFAQGLIAESTDIEFSANNRTEQFKVVAVKEIEPPVGALFIKERLGVSDRETVEQIKENPYLQYFLGLMEYQDTAPFDHSMLTHFRKRFDKEMLAE